MTDSPADVLSSLPDPSGPDPELTDSDVDFIFSQVHLVTSEMLSEVRSRACVADMYAPFQVLLRQIITASLQLCRDHADLGDDFRQQAADLQSLLDSGKLDSSGITSVPSPADVTARILGAVLRAQENPGTVVADEISALVADAMDCAYKQALSAPPSYGSVFGGRSDVRSQVSAS